MKVAIGYYTEQGERGGIYRVYVAMDEHGQIVCECERRGQLIHNVERRGYEVTDQPLRVTFPTEA